MEFTVTFKAQYASCQAPLDGRQDHDNAHFVLTGTTPDGEVMDSIDVCGPCSIAYLAQTTAAYDAKGRSAVREVTRARALLVAAGGED